MPAETPEGDRIAKVLSRSGVASRREAERMIELGQVAVNGKIIDSPALNVTPRDRITVNGEPLAPPEPPRLWLYYKPEGLVTSASDEKGRDTVFDNLPEDMPRVMSVGRLDLNSEGLLLLTNDGELKRRLELPSTGWLRKYRVRINGNPTDPDFDPLRKGIEVEGEKFQPMEVKLDRVQGANAWVTVGLREGKNREIRRAMAAIGLYVNRLIRTSYGPFRLNEMQPGEVQEIRPKVLRDQLGLDPFAETTETKPGPGKARPSVRHASTTRPAGSRAPGPRGTDLTDLSPRGKGAPRDAVAKKPFARSGAKPAPAYAEARGETRGEGKSSPRGTGPARSAATKSVAAKPAATKSAAGKTFAAKPATRSADAKPAAKPQAPRSGAGQKRTPRTRA